MPNTLIPAITPPEPYPRLRWTVAAFERLESTGLLAEGRYELIEGDIIQQTPIKPTHATVIMRLIQAFSTIFGFEHLLT